jgi:hypothetical protein
VRAAIPDRHDQVVVADRERAGKMNGAWAAQGM